MSDEKLIKAYEEARNIKGEAEKIKALECVKKQFEDKYKNILSKTLDMSKNARIPKEDFELYCEVSLILIQALDEVENNKNLDAILQQGEQVLKSVYRLAYCYSPGKYQDINGLLTRAETKSMFPDLALFLSYILAILASVYSTENNKVKAQEYFDNAHNLLEARYGKILEQNANTILKKDRALRDTFKYIAMAKADFLCGFEIKAPLPKGVTRRTATEIYFSLIRWVNSSEEPYNKDQLLEMHFNIAVNLRKEAMELMQSNNLKDAAQRFQESAEFDMKFILGNRDSSDKFTLEQDSYVLAEDFIKNLSDACLLRSKESHSVVPAENEMWRLFIAFVATADQLSAMLKMATFTAFHTKKLQEKYEELKVTPQQIADINKFATLAVYAEVLEKLTPAQAIAAKAPVAAESPAAAELKTPDPVVVQAPKAATQATISASVEPTKRRRFFVSLGSVTAAASPAPVNIVSQVASSIPAPAPVVVATPAPASPDFRAAAQLPAPVIAKQPYQPREQEFFTPVKDDRIKCNIKISDWNELDDQIYAAARVFNLSFNCVSSNTNKYQKVNDDKILKYKIIIEPPAHLSPPEKLAYGKRIKQRLIDVYGIKRNTHLQDQSASKTERYNEYYANSKDKDTKEMKPKLVGNILPQNAIDGTVVIYGSTASLVTKIVAMNNPRAPQPERQVSAPQPEPQVSTPQPAKVEQKQEEPKLEELVVKISESSEKPTQKLEKLPKAKKPKQNMDQKNIDSRAKALFKTTFKQAYREVKLFDTDDQIGGVDTLTNMYINAMSEGRVNIHVTNCYVAALIIQIDALMVNEQYYTVLLACDALKQKFSRHGKYKEEARRLETLCNTARQHLDDAELITGVDTLTEIYRNAITNEPVNYHVINMYVAALILKIDALIAKQQYKEALVACEVVKREFPEHDKYLEEAPRLESLYKAVQQQLGMVANDVVLELGTESDPDPVPESDYQVETPVPAFPPRKSPARDSIESEKLVSHEKKSRVENTSASPVTVVVAVEPEPGEVEDVGSASKKRENADAKDESPSPSKKPAVEPQNGDPVVYSARYKFFKNTVGHPAPPIASAVQEQTLQKTAPRKRQAKSNQGHLLAATPGKKVAKATDQEDGKNNTPKK